MDLTFREAAIFLPLVAPICLWVAMSDLRHMKIRNKAVLALAAVFVIVGPLAVPLEVYPWRLAQLVAVLALGIVANALGLLGAGDAKFAAAMAPFVAAGDAQEFLVLLAMTMLAAFVIHRLARALPALRAAGSGWASWQSRKFPLGLALGPALAFYLALGLVWGA